MALPLLSSHCCYQAKVLEKPSQLIREHYKVCTFRRLSLRRRATEHWVKQPVKSDRESRGSLSVQQRLPSALCSLSRSAFSKQEVRLKLENRQAQLNIYSDRLYCVLCSATWQLNMCNHVVLIKIDCFFLSVLLSAHCCTLSQTFHLWIKQKSE